MKYAITHIVCRLPSTGGLHCFRYHTKPTAEYFNILSDHDWKVCYIYTTYETL